MLGAPIAATASRRQSTRGLARAAPCGSVATQSAEAGDGKQLPRPPDAFSAAAAPRLTVHRTAFTARTLHCLRALREHVETRITPSDGTARRTLQVVVGHLGLVVAVIRR